MKQLLYISRATPNPDLDALHDLLVQARRRNGRLGVTGLLLYGDGRFMQVIEGPTHSIDEVYASICADARHADIETIYEAYCDQRSYSGWRMAYRPLHGDEQAFVEAKDVLEAAHGRAGPIDIGPVMRTLYRQSLTGPRDRRGRLQ
ncbi:MAG: BLUF domain-containing protein [Pseudomonadota bacterium]